jgi:hypothetical protein
MTGQSVWRTFAATWIAVLLAAAPVMPGASETDGTPAIDLMSQSDEEVARKNTGCVSCHTASDAASMHEAALPIACVDCHGGTVGATDKEVAHVAPSQPEIFSSSANPKRSNAAFLKENPEFVRFVNPGDLRIADQTCGVSGCHEDQVARVRTSMMTHGGSLWGAALYNNGAVPVKNPIFGESYGRDGEPQAILAKQPPTEEETREKGWLPFLLPLPRWEITQPGNILRFFERGGKKPLEVGNVNLLEPDPPGRPERRLSQRGLGTANRTDPVFIGLQKTRLMDPMLSLLGTNDHPGDFRSSGCTGCHVLYANDRNPVHSGPIAKFGNRGWSASLDPMIPKNEPGHPIEHKLTKAIPSSQCVVCHMHPGTNVVNTYFGTTWWDNETDGEHFYEKDPKHLSPNERVAKETANPNAEALRGKWSEPDFLANLTDLNPRLAKTQVADFHGHGWVFRNVYKQDRKGNLLDKRGKIIRWDDPERFEKAVHLMDIHLEKGMHCVDCHFEQDAHGDGNLYGEVRNAIEIQCIDCHGSIAKFAPLGERDWKTTGPAGGSPLKKYNRTAFGERFFKKDGKLFQRSAVTPGLEWELVQTRDTVDPDSAHYSESSRLAKTIRRDGKTWGNVPDDANELAHRDDEMTCFACHSSWMTSCFGCHLSQTANRRTDMLHNEGEKLRNWTSYGFQVLRDDVFMLGRDGTAAGGRISPVRSSSAVVVSSQNQNREWFYAQQQTISSEGYSGQAFNTHVPHTVRGTETKICTDCHVSSEGDNNAVLAQLLLLGTQFVNFFGQWAWVGLGEEGLEAIKVTEWEEPQAVIGSNLHKIAFPREYANHVENDRVLEEGHHHPGNDVLDVSWMFGKGDEVRSLQVRGEFLYAANGPGGLRVYDVANIQNKAFSERITTAPFSPLGQRLYVKTKYATSVASPTTLGVDPARIRLPENEEQPIHLMYAFLYVTDLEEGLILVNAATLLDGNPTNNFLERAVTFNPDGILDGAVNVSLVGTYAYVLCARGLVVVDVDDPLNPKVTAEIGAPALVSPRSMDHQFRYAFVADGEGLKVLDVTDLAKPKVIAGAAVPIAQANDVYVARTYAYVAAGPQGLVIVDVEKPAEPKLDQTFDAGGALDDARAVRVGMTNASAFAYVADGKNGLRVLQLTSPRKEGHYGFSPRPEPELIATFPTKGPAIALSKGLDRDRAVDESGNQLAVFGRRGGRPLKADEMRRLYLRDGEVFTVTDFAPEEGTENPFRLVRAVEPASEAPSIRRAPPADRPGVRLRSEQPGVRLREEPGVRLRPPE